MKVRAPQEYARAFSAAFVADIERAPSIKAALREGRLDARGLANMAMRDMGKHRGWIFRNVRSIVKKLAEQEVVPPATPHGMAQWAELAGALLSTAANVAGKVYSAKLDVQAQESLAKLEAQKQQAALAAAELQAKAARLQYSQAEAAVRQAETAADAAVPKVLGVPWWGAVLGVLAVGTVGYLAFRGGGRRRR